MLPGWSVRTALQRYARLRELRQYSTVQCACRTGMSDQAGSNVWPIQILRSGAILRSIMRLGSLCGRPLVHGIWGWIAGWIYDIWLDFRHTRVAAFQICEPDRMQFPCVEPFALRRSTRYGLGIDVDPGKWQVIERDMQWASVRAIEDVTVVSADGEWSCVVRTLTATRTTGGLPASKCDDPG